MSVDYDFSKLMQRLKKLENETSDICEACVKELGGRFLALVITETPKGKKPKYDSSGDKGKTGKIRPSAKAKKRRFDDAWDGYIGGTLRRGWTAKTHEEAENGTGVPTKQDGAEYVQRSAVTKNGKVYTVTLINPVKYATYVEYGHRQEKGRYVPALGKRLIKGFSPGKFFLRRSWDKLRPKIPAILNKKLNEEIKKRFDNG